MARSPFLFNTHDLPRRAGEFREYSFSIKDHGGLGFEVLSIAKDQPIEIELKIESVSEGVLASAQIEAIAVGECGRCLDQVEFDISESFQELYEYEEDKRHANKKSKSSKSKNESEDEDELEIRKMVGDDIDLDGPIRDAIILNLPQNPLCKPDCKGLCPDCGEKLESLPADHAHEKVDARWAALGELKERLSGENKP
jgi:uncharacterized protein